MAKLIIFLAGLATFLLVVDASIYRTTVVINEDEENPRKYGGCEQKFQQVGKLDQCQKFIRQEMRGIRDDIMEENYHSQGLRQCCQELQEMGNQCACDGLKMAVREQQQRGKMGSEEMREALTTASSIPSMCRMPVGRCEFGSGSWF